MRLRAQAYSAGRYAIVPGVPDREAVECFIRELRFLDLGEPQRLWSHNPHRRVYALRLAAGSREVVVKMQWINPEARRSRRMVLAALWRLKNKALKGILGARQLQDAGLRTCDPLALWTYRPAGERERRYQMYARIPAPESLRAVRERLMGDATRKRNLLREAPSAVAASDGAPLPELDCFTREMASYLRRLHEAGLRHHDVCSGNWLYTGSPSDDAGQADIPTGICLWLIDTESVHRARIRVAPWKRIMDLRSLRRLDLTRRERALFMTHYLDCGGGHPLFWLHVFEFWWYGPRRYTVRLWASLCRA